MVGGWEVGGPLGLGGSTFVRVAVRAGESGAFKRLRGDAASEVEALRRVRHPGVVRLLDAGEDAEGAWVVMERVAGPPLLALRRPPGLPAAVVLGLARELAEALAACHAVGVAHRDVKPGNVRLRDVQRPVLVDFGSAGGAGSGGAAEVTPAYAAPEWFAGASEGAALDAYALGVTLFELWTGTPAFPRSRLEELAAAKQGWLPVGAEAGEAAELLSATLRSLCAPSPADRPPLAEVAAALAGWPLRPLPMEETAAGGGDTPAAPALVGRYRLEAEAGRGGMGVVYRAWDPSLARPVAIKRVQAASPEARARFAREALAAARVDHPGVVRVLDVGEDAAGPWMAQEWVEGGTLLDRLRPEGEEPATTLDPSEAEPMSMQRLPTAEALRVAAEVGASLAAAHRVGVVHRDVKPGNILFDARGRARLADFGVAAVSEGATLTRASQAVGTPAWMAPEQAWGGPVDGRADVWGLGATLLAMLAGRAPYGRTPTPLELPADLPASVVQLCRVALRTDPAARWRDMDTFVDALREAEARLPSLRPAGSMWRRLGSVPRAWWVAGLGAGVVAAALLGPSWLAERRAAAREAEAAVHVARVRALVEDPEVAPDAVEQAFNLVRGMPELVGTAALADVWSVQAAWHRRRGDAEGARVALAQAWVTARDGAARAGALGALAEDLQRGEAWERLDVVVAAAAREGVALPAPVLAAANRARRAGSPEGPLAAWWRAAAARPFDAEEVTAVDLDGDGREELVGRRPGGMWARPGGAWVDGLEWPLRGMEGRYVHATAVPWPGGGAAFVLDRREDGLSELRVPDGEGGWRSAVTWPFQRDLGAVAAELDGDGRPEVVVATGQPARELLRVQQGPDGGWTVGPAHRGTSSLNSDLFGPVVVQDPAGGPPALVVAASAWGGFDLRRFLPSQGGLTLDARVPFGNSAGVVRLDTRAGPRVAVLCPGPTSVEHRFPPASPGGAVAGVHLFDAHLRPAGAVVDPIGVSGVLPADVDADGADELVLAITAGTRILRVGSDGPGEGHTLRGVWPVAVGQADEDPEPELWARGEGGAAWVLGVGALPLPPLPPPLAPAEPPEGLPAAMRAAWRRAELLVLLDLPRVAEDELVAVGRLTAGAAGAAAFVRAAEVALLQNRRAQAEGWLQEAMRDPSTSRRAARVLAALQARAHRWADAASSWRRAGAPTPVDAGERLAAAAVTLGATPTVTLDLRQPLHPAWQVPMAPPRPRSSLGLPLASNSDELLLALPLTRTGEVVGVDLDLVIERLEWGSTIALSLVPEGGGEALTVLFDARGGGGQIRHRMEAWAEGHNTGGAYVDVPRPDTLRRTFTRLAMARQDRARVMLSEGFDVSKVHVAESPGADAPLPRRWRLEVRGSAGWRQGHGLALATLERVVLTGLAPVAAGEKPDGNHAVADGRLAEGAADPGAPAAAWRRLVVASNLGDTRSVAAALAELGPGARTWKMLLLRTSDRATIDLLRADAGPTWASLFLDAWGAASWQARPDPEVVAAWVDDLGPASQTAEIEAARARMLRLGGRGAQALEAARRAARLADAEASAGPFPPLARARWEEALLLAEADPDAARAAVRAALAASPAPEVLADLATFTPELGTLLRDPDYAAEVQAARAGR